MEFMSAKVASSGLQPKFKASGSKPTYCSAVFVPMIVGGIKQYVLTPEVMRRLCKLGWSTKSLPKSITPAERLKSNELSNMSNSAMPISRVFYKFYTGLKVKTHDLDEFRVHALMTEDCYTSAATMEWFQQVYGLGLEDITELESFLMDHLERANLMPSCWNHHLADKMYRTFNE